MSNADLVALQHQNWIAYLTGVVSCASRANITRAGGVVTILSGRQRPSGQVVGLVG